jgi:hypothetical protein
MRRGLMAWDCDELPLDALNGRVERLQGALSAASLDAVLLYTNFIRSAAVSWLTAFSPYWADGVLMVPKTGEPIFATTLSNRVATWVESVKPVGRLVHSPTPGAALGERLRDAGAARIGVLELDSFPGGVYDEFAEAAPGIEILDATELFDSIREPIDRFERALLRHADDVARAALDAIDPDAAQDAGACLGLVEREARRAGAEEAYLAIAPNLDVDARFVRVGGAGALGERFAVRASVAYKSAWVRHTRTYAKTGASASFEAEAARWFDALAASLDLLRPPEPQLRNALKRLPGADLRSWLIEAPVGTQPLAPVAAPRSAVTLSVHLASNGRSWLGAGLVMNDENG